jgi:hypothetical protein
MEASVVLLEAVSTEQFPGELLQLQDMFGNPWTAAAAQLSAAARAAAAGDAADAVAGILPTPVRSLLSAIVAEPTDSSPQQKPPAKRLRVASGQAVPGPGAAGGAAAADQWRLQLQLVQGQRPRSADGAAGSSQQQQQQQQQQQRHVVSEVAFDAEGCCRLAAASLQSLGISSTGEYALHAVAVTAGAGTGNQVGCRCCMRFVWLVLHGSSPVHLAYRVRGKETPLKQRLL